MPPALVDSLTITEPAPGAGTVTIGMPTAGDRDLTIVALALPAGSSIPSRRPPFPSGYDSPVVADVPGWATVTLTWPLVMLARFGAAASLDLPVRGDGGTLDGVAASFSVCHRDGSTAAAQAATVAPAGSLATSSPPLDVDGVSFTVAATASESGFVGADVTDSGWTPVAMSNRVALEWQQTSAGSPPGPTWAWTMLESSTLAIATAVTYEGEVFLECLRSASYLPPVMVAALAPGDPPAMFTELVYRSDGVAPAPLPVLTPAEPWWPNP